MKFTIHKHLGREKLLRVLPKSLAAMVPQSLPEPVTAVLFPGKVITSRNLSKALDQVADLSDCRLVFAGADFTLEAIEIAADLNAVVLSRASGAHIWTDRSLIESHILDGTNVKNTPDGIAQIRQATNQTSNHRET